MQCVAFHLKSQHMEAVSIVMGLIRVVANHAIKKMSLKIEKHEKIAMLDFSSLNTISSLISKALSDDSISDEEYSLILFEFETFTRMKEDRREKSMTSLENTGNIETEANELLPGIRLMFRLEFVLETVFKIMFKTVLNKQYSKPCPKIKKIANKSMSFLKITDPKKRDFIVNEFLNTRQNIQQNFL